MINSGLAPHKCHYLSQLRDNTCLLSHLKLGFGANMYLYFQSLPIDRKSTICRFVKSDWSVGGLEQLSDSQSENTIDDLQRFYTKESARRQLSSNKE